MIQLRAHIDILDALIIGAGPAGLTAAVYLGRFRRKALVIHAQASRARWIPESHNIPGFAHGIGGAQLLARLQEQANRYGADVRAGEVGSITRAADHFAIHTAAETFASRYVLLATGTRDHLPDIEGAEAAVRRSLLRICPICDAYEAIGKTIGVISNGEHGEREAQFLATYSDRVTLLHVGERRTQHERLRQRGMQVIEARLEELTIEPDAVVLRSAKGPACRFEICYSALGCTPQNNLAVQMGAAVDEAQALIVNAHQETSIAGLYAAGDVVRGLNQVVVAAAEAAIAATDIHNKLRELEG